MQLRRMLAFAALAATCVWAVLSLRGSEPPPDRGGVAPNFDEQLAGMDIDPRSGIVDTADAFVIARPLLVRLPILQPTLVRVRETGVTLASGRAAEALVFFAR